MTDNIYIQMYILGPYTYGTEVVLLLLCHSRHGSFANEKRVIRRLPLMEQDPLTFLKHMNHLVLVFADPVVSCVVFIRLLFDFLSFLFRLLYCLFVVDLRL